MENECIAQSAMISFRPLAGFSSQRGRNSRKDSDILHFPFSILNYCIWI